MGGQRGAPCSAVPGYRLQHSAAQHIVQRAVADGNLAPALPSQCSCSSCWLEGCRQQSWLLSAVLELSEGVCMIMGRCLLSCPVLG